jgi:hypothetical protein
MNGMTFNKLAASSTNDSFIPAMLDARRFANGVGAAHSTLTDAHLAGQRRVTAHGSVPKGFTDCNRAGVKLALSHNCVCMIEWSLRKAKGSLGEILAPGYFDSYYSRSNVHRLPRSGATQPT